MFKKIVSIRDYKANICEFETEEDLNTLLNITARYDIDLVLNSGEDKWAAAERIMNLPIEERPKRLTMQGFYKLLPAVKKIALITARKTSNEIDYLFTELEVSAQSNNGIAIITTDPTFLEALGLLQMMGFINEEEKIKLSRGESI